MFAAMTCVNLLFSPQKLNSNKTLQLNTGGFNAVRSPFPSVSVVNGKMSKFKGLGKTHRKRICSRTENFARPFITSKLFEGIQILNE